MLVHRSAERRQLPPLGVLVGVRGRTALRDELREPRRHRVERRRALRAIARLGQLGERDERALQRVGLVDSRKRNPQPLERGLLHLIGGERARDGELNVRPFWL